MADLYNMSFLDTATNPLEIITGIGSALPAGSEFLIGNLLLASFFIIFLILSMRYDFNEVLIVDAFITSMLAILLYSAGMIAVTTIAYPIVIFFMTLVFYLFNK